MERTRESTECFEEVTTRSLELHDQVHAILINELIELHRFGHFITPETKVEASQPEVPYDYYGHKGSIDLVEWIDAPIQSILCIYEIKSKMFSLEETLRKFKEKAEFFPKYLEKEKKIASIEDITIWSLLVFLDSYENTKVITDHLATFERMFATDKPFLSTRSQYYLVSFDPLKPVMKWFFLHKPYERERALESLAHHWKYQDASDFLNRYKAKQGYLI